jgi:predicted SnoaL-like aldol condensation-catalyzing enzyme
MSTGDNKAIVTRFSADVWNSGNLATVEDYIAADYIRHDPGIPMQVRGPEGIKQLVRVFRNPFLTSILRLKSS